MNAGERRAFMEGVVWGAETQIEAHDPLVPLLADVEGLLRAVARDYPEELGELERAAEIVRERGVAAFGGVGDLRAEGPHALLEWWELERSIFGA